MKWTSDKELNKILDELVTEGWAIERGKKHFKARHPHGGMVTISISPSCHHAYKNIQKDVKRLKDSHASNQSTVRPTTR